MAVENGFSFNQISSSEFLSVAFNNLGLKHKKSRNTVSICVNNFIGKMAEETKEGLKKAFENGERFSIVIDEWTSIGNKRFLNVCVVTSNSCTNLGLARCRGSMTAVRTVELLKEKLADFGLSTSGLVGLTPNRWGSFDDSHWKKAWDTPSAVPRSWGSPRCHRCSVQASGRVGSGGLQRKPGGAHG